MSVGTANYKSCVGMPRVMWTVCKRVLRTWDQRQSSVQPLMRLSHGAGLYGVRGWGQNRWCERGSSVLSQFSSGLFQAIFTLKETASGKEIHRRVSSWCCADHHYRWFDKTAAFIGFGGGQSKLNKWGQQHQHVELMSGPLDHVEKENTRLRKEVRLLREERTVLKNAALQ